MNAIARLATAAALALPAVSFAGPSDYVYSPAVEYGEREVDFKLGSWKPAGDGARESAASVGLGYGATQRWFTEVYLKYARLAGELTRYDAFEWENKFQLTEPNQYAVDVGLVTEIEVPRERREEGYEFKIGPLFQGDTGPVRWNANVLFERVFRGRPEAPRVTEIGYQLQARYALRRELELGAQAFGEMGKWNHWEPAREQKHLVGPAIFGKVKLGEGREAIRYNAAILFAASDAAPRRAFRLQAEYEF
ncbi:MAG: hypothetical protein ABIQ72_15400 [Usitatibacter sp.]